MLHQLSFSDCRSYYVTYALNRMEDEKTVPSSFPSHIHNQANEIPLRHIRFKQIPLTQKQEDDQGVYGLYSILSQFVSLYDSRYSSMKNYNYQWFSFFIVRQILLDAGTPHQVKFFLKSMFICYKFRWAYFLKYTSSLMAFNLNRLKLHH